MKCSSKGISSKVLNLKIKVIFWIVNRLLNASYWPKNLWPFPFHRSQSYLLEFQPLTTIMYLSCTTKESKLCEILAVCLEMARKLSLVSAILKSNLVAALHQNTKLPHNRVGSLSQLHRLKKLQNYRVKSPKYWLQIINSILLARRGSPSKKAY